MEHPVVEEEGFVGFVDSGFDDGFSMADLGFVDDGVGVSRVVEIFVLEDHADVGMFCVEG